MLACLAETCQHDPVAPLAQPAGRREGDHLRGVAAALRRRINARGAGQYFTSRPVIQAICHVVQPTAEDRICDPGAGTGGFLCNACNYALERHGKDLDADEKIALRDELVVGMVISDLPSVSVHGIRARGVCGEGAQNEFLEEGFDLGWAETLNWVRGAAYPHATATGSGTSSV
jgi:hypothetical protein